MVSIMNACTGFARRFRPSRKRKVSERPVDIMPVETSNAVQTPPTELSIRNSSALRSQTSHVPVVREEAIFNIEITYNGRLSEKLIDFSVSWAAPSMLDALEAKADTILRKENLIPSRLHRTSGRCCLVRRDNMKVAETKLWTHETSKIQWADDIPLMIMEFCTKEVKVPFYLEVVWNYEDQAVPEAEGEEYATTIHKAINRKMTKNWEEDPYISQSNLETILSKSTISLLVERDISLQGLEADDSRKSKLERRFFKETFIEDVWTDAIRHLALHICVGLPLACLFEMMQRGARDRMLFHRSLEDTDCPHEEYSHKFKNLVQIQSMFIVYNFADKSGRPVHELFHDRVTIPIEKREKKGKGGFGEVFSVSLKNEHHAFEGEEGNECFAMKIFTGYGSKIADDFNRESKMLETLADFPHQHVTPHLASWTQKGRFYMLFPLATRNLRTFLETTPAQPMSQEFVEWLLQQLWGLADGVRMIHNLGPARLGPGLSDGSHPTAAGNDRTGFHHDLKPENILMFEFKDLARERMRISDFGSAKVSQILSGSGMGSRASYRTPGQSPGDPAYGAPETDVNQGTSRPYDIWSLGCIFLEILLWVFRIDLKEFPFERLITSNPYKNQNQAFWYKAEDGKQRLKPAVVKRLKNLIDQCEDRGVFEKLVYLVCRMLKISEKERIQAPALCNALDALRRQAERDLRDDPDAYQKHKTQNAMMAPPTTIVDDIPSPSDQDLEILTPSPSQLMPNGFGHHRRRSDSRLVDRSRIPLDRSAFSDHKRLKSLLTDLPTRPGRQRSPSITIFHHDNPDLVTDGLDVLEAFEQPPPVGAHSYPIGFEEFASRNGRPRSVRSQRSKSESDVPDHIPTSSFGDS